VTNPNSYRQAEIHARTLRDFRIHLLIFLPSALLLGLLALLWAGGRMPLLVLLAVWALGLACHALALLHPLERLKRFWEVDASRRH